MKTVAKEYRWSQHINEIKDTLTYEKVSIRLNTHAKKSIQSVSVGKYDPSLYRYRSNKLFEYIQDQLEGKVTCKFVHTDGITTPRKHSGYEPTLYDNWGKYIRVSNDKVNTDEFRGDQNIFIYILPYTYSKSCKLKAVVSTCQLTNHRSIITNIKTLTKSSDVQKYTNEIHKLVETIEIFESKDGTISIQPIIDLVLSYQNAYTEKKNQATKQLKKNKFSIMKISGKVIKLINDTIQEDYKTDLIEFVNNGFAYYAKNNRFEYRTTTSNMGGIIWGLEICDNLIMLNLCVERSYYDKTTFRIPVDHEEFEYFAKSTLAKLIDIMQLEQTLSEAKKSLL